METTNAVYISPLFNNNFSSHETLGVYTTIGTLHIDILKNTFRHIKQYREIS
jgi:hypothetical protein